MMVLSSLLSMTPRWEDNQKSMLDTLYKAIEYTSLHYRNKYITLSWCDCLDIVIYGQVLIVCQFICLYTIHRILFLLLQTRMFGFFPKYVIATVFRFLQFFWSLYSILSNCYINSYCISHKCNSLRRLKVGLFCRLPLHTLRCFYIQLKVFEKYS